MLKSLYINQDKQIILVGDLNLFFSSQLKAKGGKALPKQKSIVKISWNKKAETYATTKILGNLRLKILHLSKTTLDL